MTKHQLPLDELSIAIGRILGLLLTEEKVDHAVQKLSLAIKDSIPGTVGAGVSILDQHGRRTSRGFTDPVVEQADSLQYQLGTGPCLTAWASNETILVRDLTTDPRWPEWTSVLGGLPITSVISAPLIAGNRTIGAIKVYSPEAAAYDEETVRLLELFASPAATLLSHIQSAETPKRISEGLQSALSNRDLVNRAVGILMERHHVSHEAALQRLLKSSRAQSKPLQEVSADTVAGTPADHN